MNTIKKANVEHRCEICDGIIKKGNEYLCIKRGNGVNSYNIAICKRCSFRRNQDDYNIYTLRDCNDSDVMYGAIALNNKHTIKDFQDEINRVKDEFVDDIAKYGDDWSIISQNISESFDWFEIGIETEDYLEY